MMITLHARLTAFYRLLRDLDMLGLHHRIPLSDLTIAWSVRSGLRKSDFYDTLAEMKKRGEASCSVSLDATTFNLTERGMIQAELILYPWRTIGPNAIDGVATQVHTQHVLAQVRRRHRKRAEGRRDDGQLFDRRGSRLE